MNKKGFTLIEMMVAVSIFVIVAFIVTTTFISAMDAYRKAQAIRLVTDNVNFALGAMLIDLREGTDYQVTNNISVSFRDIENNNVSYSFNQETKTIEKTEGGGASVSITSPEIPINSLAFTKIDTNPPAIRINVSGKITIKSKDTVFAVETLVSQRNNNRQ